MIIGSNNHILIEENVVCGNFQLRTDGGKNQIILERGVYWGGGCMHAMEGTKIEIGENCMLSHDIDLRSGDGHPIYFEDKNLRYNRGGDIVIGKHVWIGIRAQILKGVTIGDNCIIGASSVVNKSFYEEGCIIAGYPATVIKRNIKWER